MPWRLPIEPASEKRLPVRLCFVKKTTNQAWEWGATYGRTLLVFFFVCLFVYHEGYQLGLRARGKLQSDLFLLFLWPIGLANERDRLYSLVAKGKRALKKKNSASSYFGVMVKVRISSDVIKPFSSKGDVVAWLKKVRLVARLQNVDDVASLLLLYLEGDALALYMEMVEASQGDIE